MAYDINKLSTIQIEMGSQALADQSDTLVVTRLMAILLADTRTLLAARKDPSVMEPFMVEAAEIPHEESLEVAEGFFEKWRNFQMRILRSAAGPDAKIETPKPPPFVLNRGEGSTEVQ